MGERVKVLYKENGKPWREENGIVLSRGFVWGEMTYMVQLDCKKAGDPIAVYEDEIIEKL